MESFVHNVIHNLFQPLLLFFYMGFLIPLFKVPFEFPKVLYQGLTIYLLVAIGWHGGEELAGLSAREFAEAGGFMVIGFFTNFFIGIVAYQMLRKGTTLKQVDAATVAGFYGSDSAGTFVTCLGVLIAQGLLYAAYMPVLLAVMEIPGCLVALYLVSRLRRQGLNSAGYMPYEEGYDESLAELGDASGYEESGYGKEGHAASKQEGGTAVKTKSQDSSTMHDHGSTVHHNRSESGGHDHAQEDSRSVLSAAMLHEIFFNPGLYLLFGGILIGFIGGLQGETRPTLEESEVIVQALPLDAITRPEMADKLKLNSEQREKISGILAENPNPESEAEEKELSEEVTAVLNTDQKKDWAREQKGVDESGRIREDRRTLFTIWSKNKVTSKDDKLFVTIFHGMLCLFLLEMGITACLRLKDLRTAGWRFIVFGLVAPNIFAVFGICIVHAYSMMLGHPFDIGTYALFAVLCAAASYIAVPAVQRLAIPEASPTLPLAASLGLTFSYNVTIGIPVYIMIAESLMKAVPVG